MSEQLDLFAGCCVAKSSDEGERGEVVQDPVFYDPLDFEGRYPSGS